MTSTKIGFLAIPLLSAWLCGCAGVAVSPQPAASVPKITKEAKAEAIDGAKKAFRLAQAAGGENAAPYDYYLAEEYLDLAIHEREGGDSEGVVEFAEKSKIHSAWAKKMAEGGAK